MDELTLELDNIEQNGILVIVRSGREKDLAELKVKKKSLAIYDNTASYLINKCPKYF